MNIQFKWPLLRTPVPLNIDDEMFLNVATGGGAAVTANNSQDVIVFFGHMNRPMLKNLCTSLICLLDGQEIKYGGTHPLDTGSIIQAGHFKLLMGNSSTTRQDEQLLYQLIQRPDERGGGTDSREIDVIPVGNGMCNHEFQYANEVLLSWHRSDKPLKELEAEYKLFITREKCWSERNRLINHYNRRAEQSYEYFENIAKQTKEKTLTECIISKTFLMEEVWSELGQGEQLVELFAEEERIDLLRSLSPEHIVAKDKYKVSELVLQDFCKMGLDSYY